MSMIDLKPLNFIYIQNLTKKLIEYITRFKTYILDTETSGLIPYLDKAVLLQIAIKDEDVVKIYLIDLFTVDLKSIQLLFQHKPLLIGHNLKFDIKMLWTIGIDITFCRFFDTYLAYKLLNNEIKLSNKGKDKTEEEKLISKEKKETDQGSSLKVVFKKYLGEDISKEEQKSDWTVRPLTDNQLYYAAKDVDLFELASLLYKDLKDNGLLAVAEIENFALPAVAEMEHIGLHTNKSYWKQLEPKYVVALQRHKLELLSQLNCYKQLKFDNSNTYEINISSPSQLIHSLHLAGVVDPDLDKNGEAQLLTSTNASIIARLDSTKYPIVDSLSNTRKYSKLVTSYILAYPDKINPITGNIHPSFWQLGTVTGRFSSSNPNFQQIPSRPEDVLKDIKGGFIAPSGFKFIAADFSQIELRMMAQLAQVKNWIDIFKKDLDLYCIYGAIFNNMPYETTKEWCTWFKLNHKSLRTKAKPFVLGYIYGLGALKAKNNAKSLYGVDVTLEEALNIRHIFFNKCPEIAQYLQDQDQVIKNTGELRTLAGRRITGKLRYTQGSNYPDQGTCADILKIALGRLYRDYRDEGHTIKIHTESGIDYPDVSIVCTIHDELIILCRDNLVDKYSHHLKIVMEESAKVYITDLPLKAEPLIGNSLAEVKD